MNQAGATGLARCFGPIGQAGDCGSSGTREPDANRHIRCAFHCRVIRARGDRIEHKRCCPCADWEIREDRMKRVAKPYAVQGVLHLLASGPGELVGSADRTAERFRYRIQSLLIRESRQGVRAVHAKPPGGAKRFKAWRNDRLSRRAGAWESQEHAGLLVDAQPGQQRCHLAGRRG